MFSQAVVFAETQDLTFHGWRRLGCNDDADGDADSDDDNANDDDADDNAVDDDEHKWK